MGSHEKAFSKRLENIQNISLFDILSMTLAANIDSDIKQKLIEILVLCRQNL